MLLNTFRICTLLITTQLGSFLSRGIFRKFDNDIMEGLNTGISIEEVLQAIFSMTPLKALRVNGIHAKFYLAHWDILGGSVFKQFWFSSPRVVMRTL
ncbi:hypothetical protein ES332_D07G188000v1 [Gossypium tomentosum]|uniref:Uncharacterized protein n=1 Tax=Gossypium tomentosum TaxID=34277 RepID=A0A5D2K8B0_GOSTO|nr:hypothetical protein ES332_D07G188000v1 [Gossypium tomentosum]